MTSVDPLREVLVPLYQFSDVQYAGFRLYFTNPLIATLEVTAVEQPLCHHENFCTGSL